MQHLLRQIGSDGSLKIPERWFPALRDLRAAAAATPVLELALAGWVNATQPDEPGSSHGTTDPATAALEPLLARHVRPAALVAALLRTVGAADLAEQARPHRVRRRPAPGPARRTDRDLTHRYRPFSTPAATGRTTA